MGEKERRERTRRELYSDIYWRGKGTVYNGILSRLSRSPIFHQLSYSFFSTVSRFPFSPLPLADPTPGASRVVVLLIKQSVLSEGDNEEAGARKARLSISSKIRR